MKVRAKIALCTDRGTVKRDAEFVTTAEQGAAWIAAGKVEAVETAARSRSGAGKRGSKAAKAAAVQVSPADAPVAEPAASAGPDDAGVVVGE